MIALIKLTRPYYSLTMPLVLALTILYALGADAARGQEITIATACGALALVLAGAYALNDACDRTFDAVNAPQRPVARGAVAPQAAVIWAAALMLAGLMLAVRLRPLFWLGLAVVAACLVLYDLLSKRLGVWKPIAVAALMTSQYPLALAQAGQLTGQRAATLAVFPIWLFLTSLGYELLKDIRDAPGDAPNNWIHRHPAVARRSARAAILLGAAALVGPCFLGCGWIYSALIVLPIAVALPTLRADTRVAIRLVYAEVLLVGVAATLDALALGL